MKMRRIGWWVENVAVLPIIGLSTLGVLYWATVPDREPPLIAYDGRAEPSTVKPGGELVVVWQVRQQRQGCNVDSMRNEIVDAQGTSWQIDVMQDAGQTTAAGSTVARSKSIPFAIAWGPAQYRRTSCYGCSGLSLTQLWPVCRTWPDVPFTVSPNNR